MNNELIDRLHSDDPLIAVVGATDTRGKYGGIIYRNLKAKGYRVVGVNPGRTEVDGDRAYPSLAALPEEPDIVNVVVPPKDTIGLLDEVMALEDPAVWIQPGAADRAVNERVTELGLPSLLDGSCIMVIAKPRASA
jgi:predicted CoA-binding protein